MLGNLKVSTGLYVNWDSFIKVDDEVLNWMQGHQRKRPEGFILQSAAEAVDTLYEAFMRGGREFLISEHLYCILNEVFARVERRLGGNGYHMGQALYDLGFNPLVSYPLRPEGLMEASPDFRVASSNEFKRPVEEVRIGDPEYNHIIFEFKEDKSRGIRTAGRHILSWDLMSARGIFDYDFMRYASDLKYTDVLALSYAHLLLPKYKCKTDEIIEYLDHPKRPKVNLELGEGSEESMMYTIRSFIDNDCLDSLSMNEMECKAYFEAVSTGLDDLINVAVEKVKDYGLDRICVHSPDFAFSISKYDARKESEAMQMARRAASALTMGGTEAFWGKTESLAESDVKKVKKRISEYNLLVIPSLVNPEPRILTGLGDTFAAVQAIIALR